MCLPNIFCCLGNSLIRPVENSLVLQWRWERERELKQAWSPGLLASGLQVFSLPHCSPGRTLGHASLEKASSCWQGRETHRPELRAGQLHYDCNVIICGSRDIWGLALRLLYYLETYFLWTLSLQIVAVKSETLSSKCEPFSTGRQTPTLCVWLVMWPSRCCEVGIISATNSGGYAGNQESPWCLLLVCLWGLFFLCELNDSFMNRRVYSYRRD